MSLAAANESSAVYFSGRSYHSTAQSLAASQPSKGTVAAFDNGDTPSFHDLLAIINPLQHIPIISTIYRQLTGDNESAMSSIIGGALYGGPIGMAASMIDLGVHDATGKSAGDNLVALVTGSDKTKDTMTAAAAPAAPARPTGTATAASGSDPAAPAKTAAATPSTAMAALGPTPKMPMPSASAAMAKPARPIALAPAANANSTVNVAPASASAVASASGGGPAVEGNYLVFGSNGGDGSTASAAAPPTVVASAIPAPKQFMVNGQSAPPAKLLPPVVAASMPAAPPAAGAPQPRVFPVPSRNMNATPVAVLPPPTTGPGALPGGKSQAMTAEQMAVMQDPNHNFLSAYTQALEKYRNAQGLASGSVQPAVATAPAVASEPAGPTPAEAVGQAMSLTPPRQDTTEQ